MSVMYAVYYVLRINPLQGHYINITYTYMHIYQSSSIVTCMLARVHKNQTKPIDRSISQSVSQVSQSLAPCAQPRSWSVIGRAHSGRRLTGRGSRRTTLGRGKNWVVVVVAVARARSYCTNMYPCTSFCSLLH